ncbi:MAG: 4-(cytidine 5'-diphospho)-2-C-methyl-D-erythritol kinase [Clostridia bacterium]|nr:4-(cytidine 5'-diphospho)-2-C-methyl-D-erythritol kinase [Clostridia bacterium]
MSSSETLTVKAPAKLNLFLEIREKLADGYHNIESVMQSITLYDELIFGKLGKGVRFDCSDRKLKYDGNLVLRAARLFFEKSGVDGGAAIYLNKRIPVSAGLGGGSSDAAATLSALNDMYGRPISEAELSAIGKSLGADVPFCLKRGLCAASGIGEKLQRIGELPGCVFVVSKTDTTVSTKTAYEALDRIAGRVMRPIERMIAAVKNRDLHGICEQLYNAFEENCQFDAKIKNVMEKHGALGTLMSGSGPSVFGIFDGEDGAGAALEELISLGCESFVCRPEKITETDGER